MAGYKAYFEVFGWVRRWRSFPVFSWTNAAALFSQGYFSEAIRAYQKGLTRYPTHPVAPYARLDLSVCCERLGLYREACEQLSLLATQKNALSELGRLRLAHALLLSDRGDEVGIIASNLIVDRSDPRAAEEVVAIKALALADGGSMEALTALLKVHSNQRILDAILQLKEGKHSADQLIAKVEKTANQDLWLCILVGQALIEKREAQRARRLLNRALAQEPRAPRVLGLLARTYLISGDGYNPSFAVQLATKACQHAGWLSQRAQATLAECFYHSGDKLAALTVAKGSNSNLSDSQIQSLLESLNEQLVS